MQGICNYTPETNNLSSVEIVSAVLLIEFMVNVVLFPIFNVLYFPQYVRSAPFWLFSVVPGFRAFEACRSAVV
jgi:hypothetical protein